MLEIIFLVPSRIIETKTPHRGNKIRARFSEMVSKLLHWELKQTETSAYKPEVGTYLEVVFDINYQSFYQ